MMIDHNRELIGKPRWSPAIAEADAKVAEAERQLGNRRELLRMAESDLAGLSSERDELAEKMDGGDTRAAKKASECLASIAQQELIVGERRRKVKAAGEAVAGAEAELLQAQGFAQELETAKRAQAILAAGREMHQALDALAALIPEMLARTRAFQESHGVPPLPGQQHLDVNLRTWIMNALVDRVPEMISARPNLGGRTVSGRLVKQDIGQSMLNCYGFYPDQAAAGEAEPGNDELAVVEDLPQEPPAAAEAAIAAEPGEAAAASFLGSGPLELTVQASAGGEPVQPPAEFVRLELPDGDWRKAPDGQREE